MITRVEPLASHHDLAAFQSGSEEEDAWLRSEATCERDRSVRSYVALDVCDEVVGFFAVAPHVVERTEPGASCGRSTPIRARIPAVLLVKLLPDLARSRRQLVDELLVEALRTIVASANAVGARLVLVEAPDSATGRFYEANGFTTLPDHHLRLVLNLATAGASLGLDQR
ncbi:MAG TPA: hypothetical protein VG368_07520 [Acidimicrobiales bacterium]|jgi:hypothetical protein|nr:hypothetical protein [Acidimicrobiales bacterium]